MSGLIKRSLKLAGHATSLALEPEFWAILADMARDRNLALPALVTGIDESRAQQRPDQTLASACRVAALVWAQGGSQNGRRTAGS